MPAFLEKKLKKEYGANSKVPYMVMNKLGAMRGNKETAKGAEMEKKHEADKGTGILNGHLGKPRFRYSHKTHRYVRSKYHG